MTSAPRRIRSRPSTLPMNPFTSAKQLRRLLAQRVALARLLAVRQQRDRRLVDAEANARVLARELGPLDEPLGFGIDRRARVDEQLDAIFTDDGHRNRDRGAVHALDPSEPQQRGGHRGAGVAGADHGRGLAVAHRFRRTARATSPCASRTALAGSSCISMTSDAARTSTRSGCRAVREMRRDRVGLTDQQDVDVALVDGRERARDDLARRAVPAHRVDRDHGPHDGPPTAVTRR